MKSNKRLIRITTVPISLEKLLEYQLRFMRSYYDITAVSSDEPWLKRIGEKEGIDTFSVEMSRQITPVSDLKALWRLYRFLKKEKPFIVHTHTPKAGIVGMLAAKLAGVPHRLHTVAGLPLMEAKGLKRRLLDFVEKSTYACSTKVYPNSKGLYDFILNNNLAPKHQLKVIGNGSSNGIDTSFFSPDQIAPIQKNELKQRLGINSEDFVFIFVGRLVGDKGINELISAFSKIPEANTKLLLVGPLEPELDPLSQDTLETMEAHPRIISIGFQKDVRPYLAISHALVFPSYREGFPNVVMQAGAMGLPAIVSNINGCNEIIVDEKNGIIIPPKDTDALYLAMRRFVEHPALLEKLAIRSRQMIVDRYEQQIVWNAILEEYKRLEKDVQKHH